MPPTLLESKLIMGRKAKLSRDDWIDAATDWVAELGVATLAVEPLARSLGVSKGGFYWCFAHRDELLSAVLERWELRGTQDIIQLVEQMPDSAQQARELVRLVTRTVGDDGRGPARAVRLQQALWSASADPRVAPVLQRITAARVRFLAQVLRRAGLPASVAEHRATLGYASYVGLVQLQATRQGRAAGLQLQPALVQAYLTMLLAPPPAAARSAHPAARVAGRTKPARG